MKSLPDARAAHDVYFGLLMSNICSNTWSEHFLCVHDEESDLSCRLAKLWV